MSEPQCAPKEQLSLAIVGGGIAGLTLCIALLKNCPSISLTLYESASAFGEIGAGVGFQPVMVRTMSLIDPRIATAFEKCNKGNGVTDPPIWFTVRVGDERKYSIDSDRPPRENEPQLGEEAFTIPARRGPGGGVHRAHFLDELVKLIPVGIARFRKRLINVTKATDGSGDAVLYFADGTFAQHTAILGCDGIKSQTRTFVLPGLEVARPVFSGKYAYRGLIPMAKAVEIIGKEQTETPQMYIGYHGHLLTFPVGNGTILNVVAFSSRPDWPDSNWVVQTSRDDMLEDFKHWSSTVRDIISHLQSPDIWALFNHLPAPTYHSNSPLVCLVGDAAHASTPHQGAGAGMCIEDVYILSQLIARCSSKQDLEYAFAAYDAVRRPRSQRLVQTSREAGMLWEFEAPGVKDNVKELERNAKERMAWIWDYDISKDLEAAEEMMSSRVRNSACV